MKSQIVYIVASGKYSDYGINAVFSTEEKAMFSWLALGCLVLGLFVEFIELKIGAYKKRFGKSNPPRWL